MSANTTQAGFDRYNTDDAESESGNTVGTRERIIGMFGNDGDIGDYDLPNSAVGNDELVMWFPEDKNAPLGIPIPEFSDAGEWEEGHTDVDDEDTRVYVATAGDNHHVVDADIVDDVADALNTDTETLLDAARTKDDMANYPFLFDITGEDGYTMVAPIIRRYDDIDFGR